MFNIKTYNLTGKSIFDHTQIRKEKILKPQMDNCGYYHYRLTKDKGIYKLFKAHRLVAKHFLPDYSEQLTVNHINYDKTDNRVENLEMLTREENFKDYFIKKQNKRIYICNETGESFISFKAWCKRNEVTYSRYRFKKSLKENTCYYNTNYTFKKVILEG